jgi:hypothetical protein
MQAMLDGLLRDLGTWIDAHAWVSVLAWRIAGVAAAVVLGLAEMLRDAAAWFAANPGIAVWAQAAATLAILAVVMRMRRDARTREVPPRGAGTAPVDAAANADATAAAAAEARRQALRCRQLVAALRAEIGAALDAAVVRHESVNKLDREIKNSIALGKIVDLAPLRFTTLGITEGVAFRALGAEIGLLPPALIEGTVKFYNRVAEQGRALAASKTVQQQIWLLQESLPRIRLDGAIVAAQLDRFERADFDPDADLELAADEVSALAKQAEVVPSKPPVLRDVSS